MEGGDGERVTRMRMKEAARRAAVKGGKEMIQWQRIRSQMKDKGAKYEKERA